MSETTPSAYDNLNDQRRLFVDAYLETLCQVKAAKAAKYAQPAKAGYKVRWHADVAAAISEALETRVMPKSECLERIKRIACDGGALDKDRLRALELTAKVSGFFAAEKVDLVVHDDGALDSIKRKLAGIAAAVGAGGVPDGPDAGGTGNAGA